MLRGLTDIPTLEIIDETAKRLEGNQAVLSAFADDAAKAEAQNRGVPTKNSIWLVNH